MKSRKPFAVFAFQFWLAISILFITFCAVRFELRSLQIIHASLHPTPPVFELLFAAVCGFCGLIAAFSKPALLVYIFWSVQRRKTSAKWLGISCLALLWFLLLYSSNLLGTHPRGAELFPLKSDAERAGADTANVVVLGVLMPLWIYRFGFSKRAKEYFVVAEG